MFESSWKLHKSTYCNLKLGYLERGLWETSSHKSQMFLWMNHSTNNSRTTSINQMWTVLTRPYLISNNKKNKKKPKSAQYHGPLPNNRRENCPESLFFNLPSSSPPHRLSLSLYLLKADSLPPSLPRSSLPPPSYFLALGHAHSLTLTNFKHTLSIGRR